MMLVSRILQRILKNKTSKNKKKMRRKQNRNDTHIPKQELSESHTIVAMSIFFFCSFHRVAIHKVCFYFCFQLLLVVFYVFQFPIQKTLTKQSKLHGNAKKHSFLCVQSYSEHPTPEHIRSQKREKQKNVQNENVHKYNEPTIFTHEETEKELYKFKQIEQNIKKTRKKK